MHIRFTEISKGKTRHVSGSNSWEVRTLWTQRDIWARGSQRVKLKSILCVWHSLRDKIICQTETSKLGQSVTLQLSSGKACLCYTTHSLCLYACFILCFMRPALRWATALTNVHLIMFAFRSLEPNLMQMKLSVGVEKPWVLAGSNIKVKLNKCSPTCCFIHNISIFLFYRIKVHLQA